MIVDANVLVYAINVDAQHHDPAVRWLESALNGPASVGFPWQSTTAFVRIITHPRILASPLDAASAWSFVEEWLDADNAWIPTPTVRHREAVEDLLTKGNITGNLVPDADLAALAIEHGVPVCSFDSDFARFADVRWFNPLTAPSN
ncbi:MAG TPA: TA system VapC family ribonuclease toxin [Stackebrandtia sp.]|jgi:toxin-antitoxin system PIN domain toxin|uniref:TA system VapC family ribonuclease toxin n=1 Tax=Stackebrandtia sp. TaxID=2023065 RepID=UPI002D4ADDB8|nr:TA system VapC family ribonuclease toxin [Stackebrandtia sp.]HZE41165.1 TA system VapC family ribonuclease toxin [Stackebrandtia sp.]